MVWWLITHRVQAQKKAREDAEAKARRTQTPGKTLRIQIVVM